MSVPRVRLREVAQINPRLPAKLRDAPPSHVTFIKMASVSEDGVISDAEVRTFDQVRRGFTYFEEGDVLLAKITPCFENGKAALARNLPHRLGFGSSEFHVLRAGPQIDARYLFYVVWNDALRREGRTLMKGAAGQRRLPAEYLANLQIPLPPLDQQRRVAALLDTADELRRDRRESLQLTERLLRAIFVDLFVRNPQAAQWPRRTVQWMAKDAKGAIRTGPFGSQLLHSEFVDQGVAVLGIDNAVKNRFEWGQARFITQEKYRSLRRYRVFPGDLIITIMGTLGRCAIVPEDIPEAINTKHLCCITLDQRKCLPTYLHAAFLNHPDVLRQLSDQPRGGVIPGLNIGGIKALELPLPPLELQQHFKAIAERCASVRMDFERSVEMLAQLFRSLQQRALRGDLDLSRVALDDVSEVDTGSPLTEALLVAPAAGTPRRADSFPVPAEIEAALFAIEERFEQAPAEPRPWSADYFMYRTLGRALTPPFSFAQIWEATLRDMEEASYETVKNEVFKHVDAGTLEQRFSEESAEIVFYPRA